MRIEQSSQNEGAGHLDVLGTEKHLSAIHTIGKDASNERKQNDRQLSEKQIKSKIKGIFCQIINQPTLRKLLHKRPYGRSACAHPHDAEIAVLECTEDAA